MWRQLPSHALFSIFQTILVTWRSPYDGQHDETESSVDYRIGCVPRQVTVHIRWRLPVAEHWRDINQFFNHFKAFHLSEKLSATLFQEFWMYCDNSRPKFRYLWVAWDRRGGVTMHDFGFSCWELFVDVETAGTTLPKGMTEVIIQCFPWRSTWWGDDSHRRAKWIVSYYSYQDQCPVSI